MAEAYLNSLSPKVSAKSAGIRPGKLNPLVVISMRNAGYDISKNETESVQSIYETQIKFDFIIFVCSESQADECPIVPYETKKIYWSIDNPSFLKGTDQVKLEKIKTIRDEIRIKVENFIKNYI